MLVPKADNDYIDFKEFQCRFIDFKSAIASSTEPRQMQRLYRLKFKEMAIEKQCVILVLAVFVIKYSTVNVPISWTYVELFTLIRRVKLTDVCDDA